LRLIIKEYLLQLKEKDELDLLLCDLLLQMGYQTDNIPKTGNRQYGVDIQAHKTNNLILCVVKQGNIDRNVWNNGQNSVRQSLEEIFDSYLPTLTESEKCKKISIVVTTNGVLDESVKRNWSGYVDNHKNWRDKSIEISFWGIDDITAKIQQYLFSEHLFPQQIQGYLRKALYFVEEPDYKNYYFEQIIDSYIIQISELIKEESSSSRIRRQFRKDVASLFMATQMIAQYASNVKRYKIGVMVSEYLLIRYWKFLLDKGLMEKQVYCEWLVKFYQAYRKWASKYYEEVKEYCETKDAFPTYSNIVEQKLMLYEVIGFLVSYGYFETENDIDRAQQIVATIVTLFNNCPQVWYAPYDCNIVQIVMLYKLLIRCGRKNEVSILLQNQTTLLEQYYCSFRKYPTSADTFRDAIAIELEEEREDYDSSGMWGYFLLWIAILDERELYAEIQPFLSEELSEVTKCVWFIRGDEETYLYDNYVTRLAGDGVAIDVLKDYDEFKERVDFILNQYKSEIFSYDELSFPSIEIIACRYFNYVPRVTTSE